MGDDAPKRPIGKEHLSAEQYKVTQEAATELPFSGKYVHHKGDGVYACVVCDAALFSSENKYDSGSGCRVSGCRSTTGPSLPSGI